MILSSQVTAADVTAQQQQQQDAGANNSGASGGSNSNGNSRKRVLDDGDAGVFCTVSMPGTHANTLKMVLCV